MIEKILGRYFSLSCDVCNEVEMNERFDNFDEAVQYKKDNGWKSQKIKGEWEDVCPECQDSKK